MDIHKLTPELSVAGQIRVEDLKSLHEQGFRGVMVNRPDGESPADPQLKDVQAAAGAMGLEVAYVPAHPGQIGMGMATDFAEALERLPKPVLAYCRSGTRSTTLWALSRMGKDPEEEILRRAKEAGYDLSALFQKP